MKAAPFALILIGVLLVLLAVISQGDVAPRIAFLAIGVLAIFGAGLLPVLVRRSS
jgi:hypothetical protein